VNQVFWKYDTLFGQCLHYVNQKFLILG